MHDLNLNHLQTFAAPADAGSFAGAAWCLLMPPSTVTAHIRALQAVLQAQLVVRPARQSWLTDIDRDVAVEARGVTAACRKVWRIWQSIARSAVNVDGPGA